MGLGQVIGYFSGAVIVIALIFVLGAVRREAHKESLRSDRMSFVVRAPGMYRTLGIICAALFGLCLIFSLLTLEGDPLYPLSVPVFAVLFAAGLLGTYYSYRWKIVVAEDGIAFTPLFGKKKDYSIGDVTHIRTDQRFGIQAYTDTKRLFTVDRFSVGSAALVSYMIEKGVRVPDRINL